MENIKQLQKLAEVFDTDKIITSDEIEQVLKGILVIMNSFKKDNQTLNKETKEVVEILLDKVLNENAKLKETVNRETSDQKEDFAKQVKELKDLVSKVQTIKPIDGVDGKDADEEKIVEDVLAKIKLPEYEVYTLEEKGEDIVAEINALPLEDEYKIDASHIKNLPESKGGTFNGGGWRNLYQLHDVELSSPTDNQVLTYDSTSNTWKNENSAGGGGAWGTITGTLSDQTDLQTALNGKADSLTADQNYVTDAQLTVIGNTSGTNTGDNAVNSLYSGLASSKQDALSGTGFVKISGTTISYDNSTYLTANQTITLSGDITGSGTTGITTTIAAGAVDIAMLSATGTPSSSTYLRGDNTWATVSGLSWGSSISGTTADGVTLTLSNSTNDAASALKLIAGNTQANQSALANLQLGTSGNVQGLLIQGTGSGALGAVGTGANHLTLWGDTASNDNIVFAVGNEVAFTEHFNIRAHGGMTTDWGTIPANPSFRYGWNITVGDAGGNNSSGIRQTWGNTQTNTGGMANLVQVGTSAKVTGLVVRGTLGGLGSDYTSEGTGVYVHGNTASQNKQAFATGNEAVPSTTWYVSTAGQTVQNLVITTTSANNVTLPNSVTSAKAGYEVTLGNTQANSPYGFLANVGTSAKVTGAMIKGTFGTATTGLTSAFTAWGNTASQATRAIAIGNGTSFTETAFINTDGKATLVDLTTTGNIELGHATDTTISRVSAGVASIEGARIITSAGTTSGTILKNNGTTFVASTETYAAPGTSGNVMTSDGTNWTSVAPAGGGGGTIFALGKSSCVAGASVIAFGETAYGDTYSFGAIAETDFGIIATRSGTLKNLYVGFYANDLDASLVFTLRINGSDTTITATRTSGSTATISDTTHTVSVSAGDVITIKGVVAGSSGGANPYYSFQLD